MANLSENPQWVDGIYQIETSDPVVGGPDGVSNRQAKELASRTRYLKKEQEKTGSDLATHAAAADPHTQYAPKENPTFTGAPKAPTPATESNSQQVATTAFVKSVAATKLAKDQNGADIPDKTTFYSNVLQRGTLGDGVTFSSCDKAGDYFVAISDPNTVSDMPTYKGQKLYGYGVLHISQHDHFVGQEYTSHNGDYAWRQKWNDGVYAPWVVALSSSRVPTAADVGALPEKAVAQAAAKLATPRTINGVPFDGTANIALTPANLGLGETVNLAAGALEKTKNGADIPDKVAFISNLIERGHLSDGGTFSACNQSGIYRVGTENPASISDMPKNSNGEYLYYYGVLSVQRIAGVITQVYKNHLGQIATRQSWDDGRAYNNWNVPYDSAINKPTATDIGAITKADADNHYVRQGSSGVVYQENDLTWNSPTGAYLKDNVTYSSLIWHMGVNTGSASAAQFYFDFANGGIKYRSSRDHHGFEKPWARIYSDQDKPTATDVGAVANAVGAIGANPSSTDEYLSQLAQRQEMGSRRFADGAWKTHISVRHLGGTPENGDSNNTLYGFAIIDENLQANSYDISIYKQNNGTWLKPVQIYHSGNKPSASDIGALTLTEADTRYLGKSGGIQDVRLGALSSVNAFRGPGFADTAGYVMTAIVNHNHDDYIDTLSRRPFQKLVNGTWLTVEVE
ncbi:phage tail protein [Pectobacterium versatile]|uniref:phage tail protein n=1 Tax=Pectobacterium versatile TaxID=2488639 RepID=UPI001F300BC5|nr:phage tail protein [Pectobacterium versatile]